MKHAIVLGSVAVLVAAIGCAPDAEPPTTSCSSITECEIGKACDETTHTCIEEPDNRFLGRFHCKVSSTVVSDLEISEVVGRADSERYALTSASCAFDTKMNRAVISFTDLAGGESMELILNAGLDGKVTLGPAIAKTDRSGDPYATLSNVGSFKRHATSVSGFMTLSTPLADGADLDGYIDVTVTLPPRHLDAVFGEPCKNGLADCGTAIPSVGGATACILATEDPDAVPVCVRTCTANGDCSLGKAVCNNGVCVRACTTDADCAALGQTCFPGANGQESRGCQNTRP